MSHSAGAANGTNGANGKPAAPSPSSAATPNNGSSAKTAALPSTPVVKVSRLHTGSNMPWLSSTAIILTHWCERFSCFARESPFLTSC